MVANVARDNTIGIVASPPGPPKRTNGYTIGVIPNVEGAGPHRGEVHPDGDEFLYVVSGAMELVLDDGDEHAIGAETVTVLRPGDACVVPRGVWHRLTAVEPTYLVHVTPGPNGGYRPLR
jgi:mannose-6-phosphate isomerase-like protein (cupin superfamily)